MHRPRVGEEAVVEASGCPALEIAGQPPDYVLVQGKLGEKSNQLEVGDRVKSFGEISGHCHSSGWRAFLIETTCYFVYYGKKGCGGGVQWTEVMLGVKGEASVM